MAKAVFIDRDGILNELVYYDDWGEWESPRSADVLTLFPNVLPALQKLQANGWMLFLVSNQPSYAKGKTSLEAIREIHDVLQRQLEAKDIKFAEFYYSYTHPNGIVLEYTCESEYRKPNPGFLLDAQSKYDLDMTVSWMVGDRDTDVECGQRAGCKTALVTYEYSKEKQGNSKPNMVCADFPTFVEYIMER